MSSLPIVDSHLDLAENVTLFGRDLTLPAAAVRAVEKRAGRQAAVSLPELERGGVAVVIATVTPGFLTADVGANFEPRSAIYPTPEEAEAQALAQIDLYERWEREARIRLLKSKADLAHHLELWQHDRKPGLVLNVSHSRISSGWAAAPRGSLSCGAPPGGLPERRAGRRNQRSADTRRPRRRLPRHRAGPRHPTR